MENNARLPKAVAVTCNAAESSYMGNFLIFKTQTVKT